MNEFVGKNVLITGASSGIGLACAELFAERGANVVTVQRRQSPGFQTLETDLLNLAEATTVIDRFLDTAPSLDVLVNNAGLMLEGTVEESSLSDWDNQIMLNLTVPFLLSRAAMQYLKTARGSIVNVGSIEGLGSNPRHPAYCASKAGLHGLTRAIAVDHGPEGVRCNAVAPGWIDTELNVDFIKSLPNPDQFQEKIGKIHPIGHTGAPKDVAELVVWLASDKARFVTGQVYTIDGGRTSKLSLP